MRTLAYIVTLAVLVTALLPGCSEKETQSDTAQSEKDQNDIAQNDIVQSDTDQINTDQSDTDQNDIERLQGSWQMVRAEQKGMPSATFANMDVVIDGNILMFMKESDTTGISILFYLKLE